MSKRDPSAGWNGVPGYMNNPSGYRPNGHFVSFGSIDAGLHRTAEDLVAKFEGRDRYHPGEPMNTVEKLITAWAPPSDKGNNTPLYISEVAKAMGVDKDTPLNLHDPNQLMKMVKRIAQQENNVQARGISDEQFMHAAQSAAAHGGDSGTVEKAHAAAKHVMHHQPLSGYIQGGGHHINTHTWHGHPQGLPSHLHGQHRLPNGGHQH